MAFAIDLGTTNSVVSTSYETADGKLTVRDIPILQLDNDNFEKSDRLPSEVFFDTDGEISGIEGGIIVGKEAKRFRQLDSDHVVNNSKRYMGTNHLYKIDGKVYEAKDIASMILQHIKKNVGKELKLEEQDIVITVPASFTSEQNEHTIKAAIQAGFKQDKISIKHEPTAALLSFLHEELQKSERARTVDLNHKKKFLVFDLGGGTLDIAVIECYIHNNELYFNEIAIGRYQELGGIDFDYLAACGMLNEFLEKNEIKEGDLSEAELNTMFEKLKIAAETIKEKLSSAISTSLSMGMESDPESISAKLNIFRFHKGRPYRIDMTKKKYDSYTQSLYEDSKEVYKTFDEMEKHKSIIRVIRKTLEDNALKKDDIDFCFMTGGMSKFPTVQEKVESYLNCPIILAEDPMKAVARGAAIYPYYKIRENGQANQTKKLYKQQKGIVDQMMLSEAVLLDMNIGLPKVIIPRNTVVPYEGSVKDQFFTSSPAGISLSIYAAEDEYDSSMRLQKTLEKRFISPVKSGTPFDINYRIDENKAIDFTILIKDTYKQQLDISIRSDLKVCEQNYNLFTDY